MDNNNKYSINTGFRVKDHCNYFIIIIINKVHPSVINIKIYIYSS